MLKNRLKLVPVLVCACLLLGCSSLQKDRLNVIDEKVYELGDSIHLKPETFLVDPASIENLADIKISSPLMDESTYDYTGFTNEVKSKGKDYLEIGEYDVELDDDGTIYKTKIIVKDTTAPEFISSPRSITVEQGTSANTILEYFTASDKDSAEISMEGDIDTETAGVYPVTIVALDPSGNRAELAVTIRVASEAQKVTQDQLGFQDDDEIVSAPEKEDNQNSGNDNVATTTPPDSSDNQGSSDQQDPENNGTGGKPTACTIGGKEAGDNVYMTFEEAYNAGTAWVRQDPDNYFFYSIGTDDCQNTVYMVTFGNSANNSSAQNDTETQNS